MNLNLSKFKKVSSDKERTTLKHVDGHSITVMHKALHPKVREQLAALPVMAESGIKMAEGGQIGQAANLKENYGSKPRKKSDDEELVDSSKSDDMANMVIRESKDPDDTQSKKPPQRFADGGVTLNLDQAPNMAGALPAGQDQQEIPLPTQAQELATKYPIPEEDIKAALPQTAAPSGMGQMSPTDSEANAPSQPLDTGSPAKAIDKPVEGPAKEPSPTIQTAYDTQRAAIDAQAKAISDAAAQQAKLQQDQASKDAQDLQSYQKAHAAIDAEVGKAAKELSDQKIDPNRYYKNLSPEGKASTMIGLILGGLGQGLMHSSENPVSKQLDMLVDRDIDAQKAEMGKKENVLSHYMRQYGNLQDATNMARLVGKSMFINNLGAAAARSQDPIAQANAMAAKGALQAQMAPAFQQLAMRQALMTDGGAHDPAEYVRHYVPEPHQAAVFKEIKDAQNVRHIAPQIDQAFDEAAAASLSKAIPGLHSAGQKHFQGLMNTTVNETEGTTRQAAFDSIHDNMTPQFGDFPSTLATKKKTYQQYLASHMAAPVAKGFGIDLDKFQSTSPNPVMQLNPQQKQYAQWAAANPKDPRAAQVFKKLGLK